MPKYLRVDIELDDKQAEKLEKLVEDDYDEFIDAAETIMMDMPAISQAEVVETYIE